MKFTFIKKPFITLAILISSFSLISQNTFRVNQYHIKLKISTKKSGFISGNTKVTIVSDTDNLREIALDLSNGLKVDSVIPSLSFSQKDNKLIIALKDSLLKYNLKTIDIHYKGAPSLDPYWGGFYFNGDYAFNLGVGFVVVPHSFGRAWFPCKDEFTEKSKFNFNINTDSGYRAICNGTLIKKETSLDSGINWHWELRDPIPAYLASVAVSKYETVNYTLNSISNPKLPVLLSAIESDTSKMKKSFANLSAALACYEKYFGKHRFERIGYNAVPFSSGAMEHATNIAYPLNLIDGTLQGETTMAHEFSHHWWGDNTTCDKPEEMWLNEGWAQYSESLFLEFLYGSKNYKSDIRSNHSEVMRWAHVKDSGEFSLVEVPLNRTYGKHVYNKGGDLIHTLRNWVGDSIFILANKELQQNYEFSNINTEIMKSVYSKYTSGNSDAFFDQWIKQKGSPHFYIYSTETEKLANDWKSKVLIKQNGRFNSTFYSGVPFTLTAFGANWQRLDMKGIINDWVNNFEMVTTFNPVYFVFDYDEKLSDAISDNVKIISKTGSSTFVESLAFVNVTSITDSAMLRIEHHWTGPETNGLKRPFISDYRYWTIGGIWPNDFNATLRLDYNGQRPSTHNSGWLDHTFLRKTEDSMVILYRENASKPWNIEQNVIKNIGNKLDKAGYFIINKIKKGDYCWAIFDEQITEITNVEGPLKIKLYPNPTKGTINVNFKGELQNNKLRVLSLDGKNIGITRISKCNDGLVVQIDDLINGIYILEINNQKFKFVVLN